MRLARKKILVDKAVHLLQYRGPLQLSPARPAQACRTCSTLLLVSAAAHEGNSQRRPHGASRSAAVSAAPPVSHSEESQSVDSPSADVVGDSTARASAASRPHLASTTSRPHLASPRLAAAGNTPTGVPLSAPPVSTNPCLPKWCSR
jgi:hypothetical protein